MDEHLGRLKEMQLTSAAAAPSAQAPANGNAKEGKAFLRN
jgi:hypothetical protein